MDPFIENSLKMFVKQRDDIFGIRSEILDFESENRSDGGQSNSFFGCIRYKNENCNILLSPPLVLKCPPDESLVEEAVLLQFANEIFVYGHILPFFAHLEPSVLELFPKFYGSFTQTYPKSFKAAIMMENLEHSSFQNAPCKSFLDYAHLSLMVRNLGKFHAFSYLAKELDPVHFQVHASSLNPITREIIGLSEGSLSITGTRGLEYLAVQNEFKSSVPVIQSLLQNADQIMKKIFKDDYNNPWAVVCHGDYLSGNVMFKYDKGQPVELKMFDVSASCFSSPALDLALVLYLNASQETRDIYWDQLIDDYCYGLSSLPISHEKLPSRSIIIGELQSKAFYAYLIASFFLPSLLAEDHNLGAWHLFLPPEYSGSKTFLELPVNVQIDIDLKIGGEIGTRALGDILKDMLKRGFIQNFNLPNV